MTIPPELRAGTPGRDQNQPDAQILWTHEAFCHFALPAQGGGKADWHREAGPVSVAIEPGGERDRVPGGIWLRRLLAHLCDTALREGASQVPLGIDATALAAAIDPALAGTDTTELEAQVAALLGCRVMISLDGAAPLSVLDARGRPRAVAAEWRPTLRLNARFLDSLSRTRVALDRAVVSALHPSALAFDIYAWLCLALPDSDGEVLAESWPDLATHFAATGQGTDAFQAECTKALALIRQACPGIEIEEDAIGVGFSARTAAPAPAEEIPPAPVRALVAVQPTVAAPAEPEPGPRHPWLRPHTPPRQAPRPDTPRNEDARQEPPRPEPPRPEPSRPDAPRDHQPRESQSQRQTISLRSHITGLHQVVWLQRANGRDNVTIEVTPGTRYDPAIATVLALEPIVLQVAGGLHARDFERVASWAIANRDLIDAFWEGELETFEDVVARVRKVPGPGADRWRG